MQDWGQTDACQRNWSVSSDFLPAPVTVESLAEIELFIDQPVQVQAGVEKQHH
jgi:hypothetical protein